MASIVHVHFPDLKKEILRESLEAFFDLRDIPGLKKKPSTSELLDWIKLIVAEDIPADALRAKDDIINGCKRDVDAMALQLKAKSGSMEAMGARLAAHDWKYESLQKETRLKLQAMEKALESAV